MTIKNLQRALQDGADSPEFSNGTLDLTKAGCILEASSKEFETFLTCLKNRNVQSKIKAVVVNPTADEKNRFLRIMAKCKSLTSIKIIALNYHDWEPDSLETLRLMRSILQLKHLHTLELVDCRTYSSMNEHTPKIANVLAQKFEKIIISGLKLQDSWVADSFIDFIKVKPGDKTKLKSLVLKNTNFELDKKEIEKAPELRGKLEKNLSALERDCASLETLSVTDACFSGNLPLDWDYSKLSSSEGKSTQGAELRRSWGAQHPIFNCNSATVDEGPAALANSTTCGK